MKKTVLLVTTALLFLGGAWAYFQWTASPEYSLLQIKTAYESHDAALFDKHVDLDTVIGRAIDAMMAEALSPTSTPNDASALGGALAAGLITLMKPALVKSVSDQIRMGIEGRSPVTEAAESDTPNEPAARLVALVGGTDASLRQTYLRRDGHTAFVGVSRYREDLQADIEAEFKMRDMGGYWQIVEISNLSDMVRREKELVAARLEEINLPIRAELAATAMIGKLSKRSVERDWNKLVHIRGTITNLTNSRLSSANFRLAVRGDDGREIKVVLLGAEDVAPKETSERTWELDVNMFSSEDQALFDLADDAAVLETELVEVVFSNGRSVELVSSI